MPPGSGTINRHENGEPTNADLRSLIETKFAVLDGKLDRAVRFIDGDSEPERGAKIRLDRLEQAEDRRKVWVGAAIVAGVSAVGASLWNILTGHH